MKKNCWRYHHLTQVYQKPQSYEVQDSRYRDTEFPEIGSETIFFVILGLFLAFTPPPPPNNPENQNFEKMKKASGDVIILNLCNKKQSNGACLLRYGVQ